jgi:hypothetical protein
MVVVLVSFKKLFPDMSRRDLGNYGMDKLKKEYDDNFLSDLSADLLFLVDNGYYSSLLDVFINWEEPVPISHPETEAIASKSNLIQLARDNLKHSHSKTSDLIDYNSFRFFYPFLEMIWSMHLEKQLTVSDVERLFSSNIGEKIVLGLDNFDLIEETELDSIFFDKLTKLKWEDKKTKKLYKEINNIIAYYIFNNYGINESSFSVRMEEIILFLIGCSAVKENNNEINANNVFCAYKTWFKLIKTDLSIFIGLETSNTNLTNLVPSKESFSEDLVNTKEESNNNEIWRGLIAGMFSSFFLVLYLDMWGFIFGGIITTYITGGNYKIGARNGFIVGSVVILSLIIFGMVLFQKVNTMFVNLFTESSGLLILVAFVLGGFISALGGLIGIKLNRIFK